MFPFKLSGKVSPMYTDDTSEEILFHDAGEDKNKVANTASCATSISSKGNNLDEVFNTENAEIETERALTNNNTLTDITNGGTDYDSVLLTTETSSNIQVIGNDIKVGRGSGRSLSTLEESESATSATESGSTVQDSGINKAGTSEDTINFSDTSDVDDSFNNSFGALSDQKNLKEKFDNQKCSIKFKNNNFIKQVYDIEAESEDLVKTGTGHVLSWIRTECLDHPPPSGKRTQTDKLRSQVFITEYYQSKGIFLIIRDDLIVDLRYQLVATPDLKDSTDNAGNTPIHVAAKYNRVRCLAVLLEMGADPNVAGPYDMFPLHLACKYNSLNAAKYLLEHEADILCRDCKNKTPLHHAARKGHKEMAEMLLSFEQCEIDCRDEDRLTPLHEACQMKQAEMAAYLIEHGASIHATDISDGTPLLFSAAEGLTGIIELILDKTLQFKGTRGKLLSLNHVDNEGTSALHLAVQNNKPEVIDLLLREGADVNIENNTGYTPLHMAVIGGQKGIVMQLLDQGSNLEVRDADHMTPVHRCAMYGKTEVLDLLIKRGANVNARTSEQMTPLLVGAWKGHLAVVECLLTHQTKLTATDSCMRTAFHWCVDQSHYNILQALLGRCDDMLLGAVDHRDQTVAHYAARTGNTMIMKTLIDNFIDLDARDQDGKTPLHIAAENGNFTSIEIQVDSSKSEINDADSDGRTPLMLACLNGHYKAARSLLALGADSSMRDENYCTALILAASKGHVKVIRHLIDDLAEVNVCDKLKNTALHMSAAGGHVDAVRLLLNRNATPTAPNSYKKSPLDMALDFEQVDVAVAMINHKKWQDVMAVRDDQGYTPMKKLIIKAPEAALAVMDRCVEESDLRKDDIGYFLKYDFQYIDPGPDDPSCKNKRFFALDTMIEFHREEMLSHPLAQSLLIMKWRKFGRYLLYSNLLFYILYVAILNAYMGIIPAMTTNILDNDRHCPIELTEEQAQNATLVEELKEESYRSHIVIKSSVLFSLQLILEIFILLLLAKEIFLLWGQKWHYFVSFYTYCNWTMMVSTLRFINPPNRYPCEGNWRGAWVSSLCAWTLMMSYLQKLDVVGIYFVMFSEVILSILKVMLVLVLFLMAFAQAFAAVLASVPGFRDTDFFPLTVLAMTLGEVNYISNFVETDNYPFTIDTYIIITIFMIVMPIALMNLLIGIAVGDIDKIQKQAYIKRIGLQSNQVHDSENRFPKLLQRKLYQSHFVIKPNEEKNTRWARFKYQVFGIQTSVEFIARSEKDLTMETLQDLQRTVHKHRHQLTQVQSNMTAQHELLKNLCDHFHIEVKEKFDTTSILTDRTDFPSRFDFI